ncbi:MAG: 50S ribosomal protein L24 [Patescibacteria group bacterium]|nr:50S ribosomal protein L24 [Patescibacteria group bacterium]
MKIKKGDKVKIISGKDKGKEGIIEKVYSKSKKVLIFGINLYKRHLKKNPETKQGGIIDVPRPLDISKLMLVCPKCKKTTRINFKIESKKKIRICKKCRNKI